MFVASCVLRYYKCGLLFDYVGIPIFEAFKVRHKNKPFTLAHCLTLIKDYPKFKNQYAALKKKGGPTTVVGNGDALKRPMGKTNSKLDEKHDATSIALQETLHGMMTQKEVRDERRRQGKEEQMKIYLEIQTKKLDMEEATKRRKLDMEEVVQTKKLATEPTNATPRQKRLR